MVSQFCGKCGNVNTKQMNFCLQCGNNLTVENQAIPSNPQPSFSKPVPPKFSQPTFSGTPFQENKFQVPPASFVPFQQNNGFQSGATTPPPAKFEHPAPLTDTVNTQKTGAGGKIVRVLGILVGLLLFFLKFGVLFLRAGRFGFVGIAIVGAIILVLVAVGFALKRG